MKTSEWAVHNNKSRLIDVNLQPEHLFQAFIIYSIRSYGSNLNGCIRISKTSESIF